MIHGPTCRIVTYLAPLMIFLGLLGTYLISPEFYLGFVLQGETRESGIVEITTFIAALAGAVLILKAAWKNHAQGRKVARHPVVAFLLCMGFASLFFAGEEISWGQTWFKWQTPEFYDSQETNLHNNRMLPRFNISIQSLGSMFMVIVFFIFPVFRRVSKNVGKSFQAAIWLVPGSLAISFVTTAFILRTVKVIYLSFTAEAALKASSFYLDFLEQINEQHEMLIAIALLLYGVQVHRSSEWKYSFPA